MLKMTSSGVCCYPTSLPASLPSDLQGNSPEFMYGVQKGQWQNSHEHENFMIVAMAKWDHISLIKHKLALLWPNARQNAKSGGPKSMGSDRESSDKIEA